MGEADTRAAKATPASKSEFEAKILEVFVEHDTTRMIIQSNRPLVSGQDVFAGTDEIPVNIGTLLSKSGDLHYYAASTTGKLKVRGGDMIALESKRKFSLPERVSMSLDQRATFSTKFLGEITAVQGDRAMIDKGTLQQVHERDIYEITDSSGNYRGLIEIAGIGDLQSSGKLYNRWEDRSKKVLEAQPGDRVKFIGQRMQFGLGITGGSPIKQEELLYSNHENAGGGGLLWNVTLPSGWGLELTLGAYQREGQNETTLAYGTAFTTLFAYERKVVRFIAPIWIKKNLFYPSLVSPFVAAGLSYYQGQHTYRVFTKNNESEAKTKRRGIAPVVGAGIEFLPTRLFRPRLDVRYFIGPNLGASDKDFKTSSVFYSLAILAAW